MYPLPKKELGKKELQLLLMSNKNNSNNHFWSIIIGRGLLR